MKVAVLTADAGQSDSATGKAHALGIGWTAVDAPTTAPMAVLVIFSFDSQEEASGAHEIRLDLTYEDGKPVSLPGSDGPITVLSHVTMGVQPNTPPDAPASAPFVVNIGPGLPLEPGRHYKWQASIDGQSEASWSASFITRPVTPVDADAK
ncbi:DUF6941 family protein [Amycolatopsis sp. NPDC005003]